jgi:hypothetical protein
MISEGIPAMPDAGLDDDGLPVLYSAAVREKLAPKLNDIVRVKDDTGLWGLGEMYAITMGAPRRWRDWICWVRFDDGSGEEMFRMGELEPVDVSKLEEAAESVRGGP